MTIQNNPLIYLALKTWQYSKGNRPKVVLYLFLFIFANLIILTETLAISFILNVIQKQGVSYSNLSTIIVGLLIIILINIGFWFFHGPARVIETANAFLVRANYKKYLLDGVMDLPSEWHTDHHSGDTIDKIEKGTNGLYNFSTDSFMVIETIVQLIGSYVALIYFNFSSIYIVFIMVIITGLVILRFDKILVAQYRELYKAENTIAAKIFDVISNITTVIILRVEKLVSKAIFKKILQPFKLFVYNSKLNELKWFLVTICSTSMIVLVLGSYIFNSLRAGTIITVGTIYALYGYLQGISSLFYRFAFMYGDIVRQKTAVMSVEEITKEFKNKSKIHEIKLGDDWKKLSIESLKFSYNNKDDSNLNLNNISITIKKGEKIALIGESGSGKTTFLKIMRGLYQPEEIQLFLDDKKLKKGLSSISNEISLIPQDPEIFNATIKENITIGVGHSMSVIKKYTDMACFSDVIEKLPKKINSSIVEKGVNLSGGEKQRLALSRGLMASKDKSIILLDEPTSSVDFKNEINIYENIFKEFKNQAIISSIHRLHLLPIFDTIHLFANGKIIASGTFEKLLANSEEFKDIWKKYNDSLAKYEVL